MNTTTNPSGLIVATYPPTTADVHRARQAAREAYRVQHHVCPTCGGTNIEQTCMGMLGDVDTNKAICCGCGWKGIVDDLKPALALGLHPDALGVDNAAVRDDT